MNSAVTVAEGSTLWSHSPFKAPWTGTSSRRGCTYSRPTRSVPFALFRTSYTSMPAAPMTASTFFSTTQVASSSPSTLNRTHA